MKKLQFIAYAILLTACSQKNEPTATKEASETVVIAPAKEAPKPVVLEDKLDSLAFQVVETLQQNKDSLRKTALTLYSYALVRENKKVPVNMAQFSLYKRTDGEYKFYPTFFTDYADGSLDNGSSREYIVTLADKDSVIANTFSNDDGKISSVMKYRVKKGDFLVFRHGYLVVNTESFTNAKKELLEELQDTSHDNNGAYGGVYAYSRD